MQALKAVWENGFCKIGGKIVCAKEGLSIGSCISPVLADLIMNYWKLMVVVMEKGKDRLLLFCRYVDDCLGIWKGSRRALDIFIKELNDNGKGMFLESEMEENKVLNFLNIRIEKTKRWEICNFMVSKEMCSRSFLATRGVTLMK